jgi:hypothetical protein
MKTLYRVLPVSRGLFVVQRNDGKYAGAFGWDLTWEKNENLAYHYEKRSDANDAKRRIINRTK